MLTADWLHYSFLNPGCWTPWDSTEFSTLRLNSILESSECSQCSRCCGNTSSTLRCCGNMFGEAVTPEWESCIVGCVFVGTCLAKPLPSYSRIFWFQYSGFQAARHNIIGLWTEVWTPRPPNYGILPTKRWYLPLFLLLEWDFWYYGLTGLLYQPRMMWRNW
jgi:hypothetical protein